MKVSTDGKTRYVFRRRVRVLSFNSKSVTLSCEDLLEPWLPTRILSLPVSMAVEPQLIELNKLSIWESGFELLEEGTRFFSRIVAETDVDTIEEVMDDVF